MAQLQLHGTSKSTCTRRVAVLCKELGLKYDLVEIALPKAEHKTPAHLSKQPFGQVPFIDDNGFILFESRAICRYLVAKYGGANSTEILIPSYEDQQKTALFEQAVSIEASSFDGPAVGIAWEKMFKKFYGKQPDEARAAEYTAILESKLDGYERILSKTKYLAGDNLTLADLFHLPTGHTLTDVLKLDLLTSDRHPNISRWWKDISSRSTWQETKDGA